MIELERHIEHLLLQSDCVIVPSLGGFVASHVAAWYDGRDNMFIPPYRTLGFNPKLNINDSLLAQSYTETYDISYPEACNRIEREVEELKQHIANNGSYELNDIGTLYLNDDGNIEFTPCEAGILTPNLYSLSSFEMYTLKQAEDEKREAIAHNKAASTQKTQLNETIENENGGDESSKGDSKFIKISAIRNLVAAVIAVFLFFVFGTPVNEHDNLITSNMDSGLIQQLTKSGDNSIKKRTNASPKIAAAQPVTGRKAATDGLAATTSLPKNTPDNINKKEKVVEKNTPQPYFCLVLASKVAKTNALTFVGELKQKGFNDAKVLTENNKSTKVIYGHYVTESEAFNSLNRLRDTKYFYDAWVYQVKN